MHQLLCGYNLQKVIQISIALGRDLSFFLLTGWETWDDNFQFNIVAK